MLALAIVASLLFAQADASGLGTLGPWVQGGATTVLAGLLMWLITKTLPKMNEASDARTVAFLKSIDDQRTTTNIAFRLLTEDYRDEMRLEREAHAKENEGTRADLRALTERLEWGANGRGPNK